MTNYYQRNRHLGLCGYCPNKPKGFTTMCDKCWAWSARKKVNLKSRAAGIDLHPDHQVFRVQIRRMYGSVCPIVFSRATIHLKEKP